MAIAHDEVTKRVRIYHSDGSVTECEVTPALAASIRRMDWADAKRERKHRKLVKNATDANQDPSLWVGPKGDFAWLCGESALWSGPAACWLKDGEICRPGEEPSLYPNGAVKDRRGTRCRFCGHIRKMPLEACCLNSECSRTGRD